MSNPVTSLNILVVDDEDFIRDIISEAAKSKGHQTFQACNGVEAMKIINTQKISIVISDIQMPEMTGLELFEKIKPMNIPVILITGFAKTMDMTKAEEIGAADFLNKPFGYDEIMNSLELVIHQMKQIDQDEDHDLDHDYCRVPIQDFISGSRVQQDIFLRLSHDKYLRVAKIDSPLSKDRLLSYQNKGLNYLYIRKEEFAEYVNFNLKLAQAAIKGKAPISKKQKMNLMRQTAEVYMENAHINGVDEASFEAGKVFVETALHIVTESDNIFDLMEILKSHSDVAYGHCLGVSIYATLMAKQVGWTSATTVFKLSMAGLLHDIGKKEIPNKILMKTRIEMSAEEVSLYESHSVRGRDLLAQISCVPEEVQTAVLQHHENMMGQGFPYRLPRSKIHPFARMIAVADEFCRLAMVGPLGNGMSAKEAIFKIVQTKEHEYDLVFIRALMIVFNYPIPAKYQNIKMANDVKAS